MSLNDSRTGLLFDVGPRDAGRETADDDLPACLRELTEPDYSDPIGAHDEELAEPLDGRGLA